LFPVPLQTLSKRIVQSRLNSTLVGVFTIIIVFISAFINIFTCSSHDLRSCIKAELNISLDSINACHAHLLNYSLNTQHIPCGDDTLVCSFPEAGSFTKDDSEITLSSKGCSFLLCPVV
ncbi:adenylate cyclase type 5, partial [Lates japonicus]